MVFEVVHEHHKRASLFSKLAHKEMVVGVSVQLLIYFFFSMTLDSVSYGSDIAPRWCDEHNLQTFKYSLLGVGAEV